MKILLYFADMFRSDLFLKEPEDSELKQLLGALGGTFYSECYTPGPDTPRGMACLLSGLLPKKNGVTLRSIWPDLAYKTEHTSLLRVIYDDNFDVGVLPSSPGRLSLFPPDCHGKLHVLRDQSEAKNFVNSDASAGTVLFVDDVTYHNIVDRAADFSNPHEIASGMVARNLQTTIEGLEFDHIFFFSDHGCKLPGERTDILSLLNENRTKILMFHHEKKNIGRFEISDKFCASLDLYPTVLSELGIQFSGAEIDGVSLKEATSGRKIPVEDYSDITAVGPVPDLFAIFSAEESRLAYRGTEYLFKRQGDPTSLISKIPVSTETAHYLNETSSWFAERRVYWDDETRVDVYRAMNRVAHPRLFESLLMWFRGTSLYSARRRKKGFSLGKASGGVSSVASFDPKE